MTATDFYEIDCDELDFPFLIKEASLSRPVHPTSTMIKNMNMRTEFERVQRILFKIGERNFWNYHQSNISGNANLFGRSEYKNVKQPDWLYGDRTAKHMLVLPSFPKCRNGFGEYMRVCQNKHFHISGIEIFKMKPSLKTMDTKFAYTKISQLRQSCKDNGLKNYSTKNKIELVKMLMAI